MELTRREAGVRWARMQPGHVAGLTLFCQASGLPGPLPGDCLTSQPMTFGQLGREGPECAATSGQIALRQGEQFPHQPAPYSKVGSGNGVIIRSSWQELPENAGLKYDLLIPRVDPRPP